MTPAKERLPLFQLLAFSAPGAATGAIFLPLTIFLPPLYSELGISLRTPVVGLLESLSSGEYSDEPHA
jgi:hypothetical protein